jgi:hypothetical protein
VRRKHPQQDEEMNDDDLLDLYALFAMLKMDWDQGSETKDADDCYTIARAMLLAKERSRKT